MVFILLYKEEFFFEKLTWIRTHTPPDKEKTENTEKKESCSLQGSNPGPLDLKARVLPLS